MFYYCNTTVYFPYNQYKYQIFSVVSKKLIHRVKEFLDYKNLSMRKFDLSIGLSDGYTQRTLKNKGSVGSDAIEKIIETYPEINPYWLITGNGDMTTYNREEKSLNIVNENKNDLKKIDHFENLLLSYLDKPKIKAAIKDIFNEEKK